METYEIRLRDAQGGAVFVYVMNCANEGQARANLDLCRHVRYHHFEIWHADSLICEGPKLSVASAA